MISWKDGQLNFQAHPIAALVWLLEEGHAEKSEGHTSKNDDNRQRIALKKSTRNFRLTCTTSFRTWGGNLIPICSRHCWSISTKINIKWKITNSYCFCFWLFGTCRERESLQQSICGYGCVHRLVYILKLIIISICLCDRQKVWLRRCNLKLLRCPVEMIELNKSTYASFWVHESSLRFELQIDWSRSSFFLDFMVFHTCSIVLHL